MKTTLFTWLFLIALTLGATGFSLQQGLYALIFVMLLAGVKFLTVAFQFMELRTAHVFWKGALICFLVLFLGLVLLLKTY
ncbi:cytochrome C oxidase subunit IV family protein [Sediminicola luteus]|uniref:Cytochrome C oxidase subunit IV n=1 Tax=Sediminicola luteus TaxID=319238 RepID=A0A2A4GC56_9FLAO|nr:cytochrome C oxidase subunit IV family protein [Sediminicola luteus]PCE66187.1 hypothetical protein B7P33_02500 [Sediminicola luteus]